MLKFIAIISLMLVLGPVYGITITPDDYGFAEGKIRNFKEGAWTQSSTDLSDGSGKSWSFTLPTTGYVNNTYQTVQNVSAFPGANLRSVYTQFVNGINDSGSIYYQLTGSDILNTGYTGYPNLVWDPAMPNGLPHYLNKTWQGTYAYGYGAYAVTGKVISEGTITTQLGTFEAVCVRYAYSSAYVSYTCYQWESEEYGIMAYTLTLNGGMLYVLYQAEPNTGTQDEYISAADPALKCWPNPVSAAATISFKLLAPAVVELGIYNLKGQSVHYWQPVSLPAGEQKFAFIACDKNGVTLSPGIYFLRLRAGQQTSTCKLIKL